MAAREGEHLGHARAWENRTPFATSESMWGVYAYGYPPSAGRSGSGRRTPAAGPSRRRRPGRSGCSAADPSRWGSARWRAGARTPQPRARRRGGSPGTAGYWRACGRGSRQKEPGQRRWLLDRGGPQVRGARWFTVSLPSRASPAGAPHPRPGEASGPPLAQPKRGGETDFLRTRHDRSHLLRRPLERGRSRALRSRRPPPRRGPPSSSGPARGSARPLVRELAREGWCVAAVARRADKLAELAATCERSPGRVVVARARRARLRRGPGALRGAGA